MRLPPLGSASKRNPRYGASPCHGDRIARMIIFMRIDELGSLQKPYVMACQSDLLSGGGHVPLSFADRLSLRRGMIGKH